MGVQLSLSRGPRSFQHDEVRGKVGVGAPGGPNPFVKTSSRGCESGPSPRLFSTRLGSGGGQIAADGGYSHSRAQCCCPDAKIDDTRRFLSPRSGRVACDAIRSSGSREVVVGSARGFAGRFGVYRLWLYRQADSIARSREVARDVRGCRRRHVVAFSTRRRSFCAFLKDIWFRVVLVYGLRGVRVGEASNPGPSRQLSPGHGSLSESPLPTRHSARLQARVPRAGHQRGLVVEVAPGVVDATAVALPSAPNVITNVVGFRRGGRSSRANPGGQR